jgi:hypothetical protein
VRYFFDKARSTVGYALADPAGYSTVPGLSSNDRLEATSRIETAYTRAVNAEAEEARGNVKDAFYFWRLIFDDYFPAYG